MFISGVMLASRLWQHPDLQLLYFLHLHLDLLGALLVSSPQCLEGALALLGGLVVAAQRLLEVAPQLLHRALQLDAQGVLLLDVLTGRHSIFKGSAVTPQWHHAMGLY